MQFRTPFYLADGKESRRRNVARLPVFTLRLAGLFVLSHFTNISRMFSLVATTRTSTQFQLTNMITDRPSLMYTRLTLRSHRLLGPFN
ncbi:hypothetical protein FIBSPDRAFT_488925 [Athelia psychrophila]|uniref:Uncharacterized protein n=1 Tax=Athelia psychrophila TaxID=1759441 RepID=A0A166KT36_9AGAM|nr:hypothetical protein FIBSPDRAFT_488925 [Fibularhizoctonia sp. CBS 109695]